MLNAGDQKDIFFIILLPVGLWKMVHTYYKRHIPRPPTIECDNNGSQFLGHLHVIDLNVVWMHECLCVRLPVKPNNSTIDKQNAEKQIYWQIADP